MKIGYGKIGRSWKLDPTKGTATGGDADVARALHILSRSRPEDEFILVGNNSGENPQEAGYPSNVVNPWTKLRDDIRGLGLNDKTIQEKSDALADITAPLFTDLAHVIMWAGQHGTSNMPIPMVDDRSTVTKPQMSFVNYGGYLLNGINRWRDQDPVGFEEIWLCPDPRNYLKARDLKWPLQNSIIAQYEQTKTTKHERFGDTTDPVLFRSKWDPISDNGVWLAQTRYTYDALELTALPHPERIAQAVPEHGDRLPFGMIVNENRAYVSKNRLDIMKMWVTSQFPDAEIFGVWSDKSKEELGRPDIRPCPYEFLGQTMQRWRTTLTTPASGSGWATAKPWECFAYGTVCFFHPHYDDQDWILRDAPKELHDWLRVKNVDDFHKRVDYLNKNEDAWAWLVDAQSEYYAAKWYETNGGTAEIIRRLK